MLAALVLAAQVGTMAAGQESQGHRLVALNWYLHFECRGCTYLTLDFDGVGVTVPAKGRIFMWTYYWNYPETLQVGEVFAEMAQKAYRITLEPAGKDAWISPLGLAFEKPPPYPAWHGKEEAPAEFAEAMVAWYDSHDFYVSEIEKVFEMLRINKKVVVHLEISVKQANAEVGIEQKASNEKIIEGLTCPGKSGSGLLVCQGH